MKLLRAWGEGAGLGSIIVLLYFFLAITYAGLTTGRYEIVLGSNVFYEHYFELALVGIGLVLYIKYRKIRFTLHPKGKVNEQ